MMTRWVSLIVISIFPISASAGRRFNTKEALTLEQGNSFDSQIQNILNTQKIPLSWKNYMNPKTAEFWTEGNHRPDAGFVLFLQDMSVESAKLWLLRGEIKARYLERALTITEQAQRELIQAGLIKDRYNVMPNKVSQLNQAKPSHNLSKKSKLLNNIQMFFIFSPSCPHCKVMAKTLSGFPNVYPLQAAGSNLHNWPGLNQSEFATRETLEGYAPDGAVPVLVLHHKSRNEAIVLKGRRSAEEILLASSQLLSKEKAK